LRHFQFSISLPIPISGQLYGLEKFWAFLKYYKNAEKLQVDPKLQTMIDNFKTIEDFRVLEPEINEMLQGVGHLKNSKTAVRRQRSMSESEGVAAVVAGKSSRAAHHQQQHQAVAGHSAGTSYQNNRKR
jgi:la-related protein 1